MIKHICEFCNKKFKTERDLDEHSDAHTPYWIRGKKIRVSGADQIRLMLKSWSGSWKAYLVDEKKRIKVKGSYDYDKAVKLKEFEEQNGIEFVVCDSKVQQYREVQRTKKGKRSL